MLALSKKVGTNSKFSYYTKGSHVAGVELFNSYFLRLERNLRREPVDLFLAVVIDDCGSLFHTAPSKQSAVIDVLLKAQISDDVLLTR